MYNLAFTNRFKKDINRLQKRGYNMDLLKQAILFLENEGELQVDFKPHKLSGNYSGFWEGHIQSDWLIIWKIVEENKELWLTRSGTHSDLF